MRWDDHCIRYGDWSKYAEWSQRRLQEDEEHWAVLHNIINLEVEYGIRQNLFDRDGMPVEKKVGQYLQELMRLFRESPRRAGTGGRGSLPRFLG